MQFEKLFKKASEHRKEHACGGYPYEHADVLQVLLLMLNARRVLELGTGLGFAAACIAAVNSDIHVETIDKDETHVAQAKESWRELGLSEKIMPLIGFAEDILPTLSPGYDLIFFDGYVPQKKFIPEFERLVRTGGVVVVANLFLRDKEGGNVLRQLKDEKKWTTAVFSDTAVAYKK